MHILCFTIEPTSSGGGAELSALDLCKGLHDRGHDISLAYLKQGDLIEKYEGFCQNVFHATPYQKGVASKANMFRSIVSWPLGKGGLIYTPQHYNAFLATMLSLTKNLPYVAHLRNPPHKHFNLRLDLSLKRVKRYIAVSEQTKQDWLSKTKADNIDVVYNGIDPTIFKPAQIPVLKGRWGLLEEDTVITYVGRLHPDKGIETLIRALPLIKQQLKKPKVLIAGKPTPNTVDYQTFLESLVTELGFEENVSFLGHIENPISLFQASDVTVLPSLWSEPFGRTVIESMACGTPVVASRTGGIPEILTGEFAQGLFEPGNEQSLSDALEKIIGWGRRSKQDLSRRCREHVTANFTLANTIHGVEHVMLDVIKNNKQ